jgi:hypothetical protein
MSLRTGTPLSFTGSNGLNAPGTTQTPNQVAPVEILHGIDIGNPWFSAKSFVNPTGANIGSVGRHIISGPGMYALNGALSRPSRFGREPLSTSARSRSI